MGRIWAGTDIGKGHHHCVVIDEEGRRLLSRRVANDENELLALLGDVLDLGDEVTWAMDLVVGGASLLTLLLNHGRTVLYLSGRAVNRASSGYRDKGKIDARDAAIIADQARVRRDLHPVRRGDELKTLTARRADLIADRTRAVSRLREQLLGIFPALEQAFDYVIHRGALVLLTGYQTPAALRRIGVKQLERWLVNRKVRRADVVARVAIDAAAAQHTALPGEKFTAQMVHTLAKDVIALNEKAAEGDKLIEGRFSQHPSAGTVTSLPGIGPLLGPEFLALTGGDMDYFGTPDRLAGMVGLAPAPRDSGRVSGNLHRPKRYQRKRAEGKRHTQAVLTPARRRVNVLWAMLRDQRCYQPTPPVTAAA